MNSTRRKYERQPVDYPAVAAHARDGDLLCRIRDFCAGGMLLELVEPPRQLQAGDELRISATVDAPRGAQTLQLTASIAHVRDLRIGIAFQKTLDAQTLADLARHAMPSAAASDPLQHSRPPAAELEAVFRWLEEGLEQTLAPMLQAHAESLLQDLQDALLASYGAQQRQTLDAAILGLGRNGAAVGRLTIDQLRAWLRLTAEGGQIVIAPKQTADSGLSLVDTAAFEQWLTVSTVATRAEEAYADLLEPIRAVLGYLCGASLSRNEVPVGPAAICQAYYEAAEPHMESAEMTSKVFALLEKNVVDQLGNYYAGVLRRLERDGLVRAARSQHRQGASTPRQDDGKPDEERQPAPATTGTGPTQPAADATIAATAATGSGGGAGPVGAVPNLGTAVGGLLHSLKEVHYPGGPAPSTPGVSNETLMQVLGSVAVSDYAGPERLPELVAQRLQTESQPGLNAEQLARAELIGQIFTRISNDRRFPPGVTEPLQSLRLPYLKLALEEPEAFADREHPARVLLDHLSDLLMEQEEVSPGLQHSITMACERLGEYFPDQPNIFEEISEEFSEIRRADGRAKLRNLERVMATQDGQQRIIDTRIALADRMLSLRDESGCLPQMLARLLKDFWADSLVNLALQEGLDGEPVTRGLEVMTLLCTALRKLADAPGSPPLDEEQSGRVLAALRAGLQNAFSFEASLGETIARAEQALGRGVASAEDIAPVEVTAIFKDEARVRQSRELAINMNNPWVRKIRKMASGHCLVVPNEHGQQKLALLAWHAADWSRMVFVNHKGMHVREAYLCDMVEGLRSDEWHFDARQPKSSVDDAILDVMQDVSGDLSIRARVDELTGLLNRKALESRLEQTVRQTRRDASASASSYLLLNIDRFRLLNLDYGHEAGDKALCAIAEALRQQAPADAIQARIGSDEFCVLIPGAGAEEAAGCAHNLLAEVSALHEAEPGAAPVTISIGIFQIDRETESADQVFRCSQAAVSHAKKKGGNRYARYDDIATQSTEGAGRQRQWKQIVNDVLEQQLLRLFHQPIRPTTADNDHRHSELLLRVSDTQQEALSTFDFIVAAEGCGRIREIDRWVLSSALTWMEEHPRELKELGGVAINLSADSLGDERFLEFIVASIRLSRIDPRDVCFELTETATVQSLERLRDFMDGVKTLGCKFALDDFGSGMASYSYLKSLPVDYLKIDGVFIRDLTRNPADAALVRSIADFSRFMGIQTVAEFVEDEATLDLLKEIGVDYAQGYHFGKPQPLPGHPLQ